MSSDEVQALYETTQNLEGEGMELARREASLSSARNAALSAAEAMRALEKSAGAGGDAPAEAIDSLVPLGAGAFVKAKMSPGSGVVVMVGAGAAIEKDVRSALNFVESRIKELEVMLQNNDAMRAEVARRLELARQQLEVAARNATMPKPTAASANAGEPAAGRA